MKKRMRKLHILATVIWVALLMVSISAGAQPDPVEWSIKLSGPAKTVKVGDKLNVEVVAQIHQGWHIYSITQPAGGPHPTRITMPEMQPFKLAGTIQGPKPEMKFDEGFGILTEIHYGPTNFTLPAQVATDVPPGPKKLHAHVRFMVCNSRLCLPPKTVKLTLDVNIVRK
jgi:thiol:disulfide interchange protein DsbD